MIFESVKALVPRLAILFDPSRNFFEWNRSQPARPSLRIAASFNQARAFEHFQMLGDRRHRHIKRLGQFGHRSLAP